MKYIPCSAYQMSSAKRYQARIADILHCEEDGFEQISDFLFDSDDEIGTTGGSRPGISPNIDKNPQIGAEKLQRDYFCTTPRYPENVLARRFQLSWTRSV